MIDIVELPSFSAPGRVPYGIEIYVHSAYQILQEAQILAARGGDAGYRDAISGFLSMFETSILRRVAQSPLKLADVGLEDYPYQDLREAGAAVPVQACTATALFLIFAAANRIQYAAMLAKRASGVQALYHDPDVRAYAKSLKEPLAAAEKGLVRISREV